MCNKTTFIIKNNNRKIISLFLVLHLGRQHEHRTGDELDEYIHEHVWNEHSREHYGQHHEHVVR